MPPQQNQSSSKKYLSHYPERNNNSDKCPECHGNSSNSNFKVVSFSEAPKYLKFNPYITRGYRKGCQGVWQCVGSTLTWTNETLNIWTHFLGWLIFLFLTIRDVVISLETDDTNSTSREALFVKVGVLICFQGCTLLSTLYHTFCCINATCYKLWLTCDLFGVSLALLGIYLSGVFFAFKDDSPSLLIFYTVTVLIFFAVAVTAQFNSSKEKLAGNNSGSCCGPEDGDTFHWRLFLFGLWAAYGVVPTFHWVHLRVGSLFDLEGILGDERVMHLLPRILLMYFLSASAFFFYVARVPERLWTSRFDYILHSHQIWHILIFTSLLYWYLVVVGGEYGI